MAEHKVEYGEYYESLHVSKDTRLNVYGKVDNITVDGDLYIYSGGVKNVNLNRCLYFYGGTVENVILNPDSYFAIDSPFEGSIHSNGGYLQIYAYTTIKDKALFSNCSVIWTIANYHNLTISNDAVFTENITGILNNGILTIGDNASFTKNGVAIYNDSRYYKVTIGARANFSHNQKAFDGFLPGASVGGELSVGKDSSFTENVSNDAGGAIGATGTVSIDNGARFFKNQATNGGAVAVLSGSKFYIGDDATFENNHATDGDGGAIETRSQDTQIGKNAKFLNNQSTSNGGAICSRDGQLTIGDGANFSGNTAKRGAGIASYDKMFLGNNATFKNNYATSSGGAIYFRGGKSSQIGAGADFIENRAQYGGAVYTALGELTIENNAYFSGNLAENGGAVYASSVELTIGNNANFSGNCADQGGALYVYPASTIIIGDNAVFSGNCADQGGALCVSYANTITIGDNAVFSGNCAKEGGAIYSLSKITIGDNAVFATSKDTIKIESSTGVIFEGDVSIAGNVTREYNHTENSYAISGFSVKGNLNLDLSVRTADSGILIDNWWKLAPESVSITIDDKQSSGEYLLFADKAKIFNSTITVKNEDGENSGILSLDMKKPLIVDDFSLMLQKEDNIVSVVIYGPYSDGTSRENQESQLELPEYAFAGMSCSNYTLTQAPDWLSIDGATGKFSGITGKITDTETGYGTTEVVISAQKGEETKTHTIEVVVVPENIEGDGALENSSLLNMTDVVAEVIENRDKDELTIDLPEIGWNYCGLDVKLSDLSSTLEITDSDYTIKLQGKAALSIFDAGKSAEDRAGLTIDLSGDNYIKVSTPKDFGSIEIDVVGELNFANLSLADGFLLKEGEISVDTEDNVWQGNAEVQFVFFDKTLKAEYVVKDKKVDTLTIELSGLDIAVGSTGLFLESISGGVKNLAAGDDKPSQIVAGADFYYGKQISIAGNTYSLATLDLDAVITKNSIAGNGGITLLGGLLSGNVSVTADWQSGSLSAGGNLTLANLTTARGAIKIDSKGNVTYSAGGMVDFSNFGINIAASSNIMLNFSNDSNYANDYYAAWCTQELFGTSRSFGVRFNLDGSWSLIGTQTVNALTQDNPVTYMRLRSTPPVIQSWDFTGISGTVLISASWDSGDAEIMLCDNNGVSYTVDEIKQHADMEIIESMSSSNSMVIAIRNPGNGQWSMSVANISNALISANILNENAAAPQITAAAGEDRKIQISWSCSTLPENAELSIYYDNDSSGNDGILIAQLSPEGTSGTFNWDVPETVGGDLHFYAVLSAPDQLPAVSGYSESVAMQLKNQLVGIDSDGWNYVSGGFYTQDAEITTGGILEVDGGSVTGKTVIARDSELILNDASISGTINLAGFMSVRGEIAATEAEIVFDLTGRRVNDGLLADDISNFSGTVDYFITLSGETGFGEYKIAGNAADFEAVFTIGDGSSIYGKLNVNGKLDYRGKSYLLTENNGNLILTVDKKQYQYSGDAVDKLVFISSKYNDRTDGKKQNGVVLIYNRNAFDSISTVKNAAEKIIVTVDSKINGNDYAGLGKVAAAVMTETEKTTGSSCSRKTAYTAQNTLNISNDTGSTVFLRFAAVNLSGAAAGDFTGGKSATNEESKNTSDRKGNVTAVDKSTYSRSASGKFTAASGSAGAVENYATVNLTGSSVNSLSGGTVSKSASAKTVDSTAKYQKTFSKSENLAASGSVTLKYAANAGEISGYSSVTLTDSTAGNISNHTSKDSGSDTATYDKTKNSVARKVTLSHTENTSGTLKATDSELGDVTGFATVTLKNVEKSGNFRRIAADGSNYSTVKETLNVKTDKNGGVIGTYTRTETFTRAGKFTAVNSNAGNIENFSTVTLDGSSAKNISNFLESKIVTKAELSWTDADDYGRPEAYDLNFDPESFEPVVTTSLKGSVTLKNGASAENISNFKSVTMTSGTVTGTIYNVNKVSVNKGDNLIGNCSGTAGNDTLTIAKGAVLTIGAVDFGDGKDKLVNNGTLILDQWMDLDDLPLSGKGEIAASADVLDGHESDSRILNLGETSENFRGTAYETADNNWKKAAKWDGKTEYGGWLGSWGEAETDLDFTDHIRFKAAAGQELSVTDADGNTLDGVSLTLMDTRGTHVEMAFAALDAGEYILKIHTGDESRSLAYKITLA